MDKNSDPSEERVWRHKPSQKFNRYRFIDRPPPKDGKVAADKVVYANVAEPRAKTPRHRPRYSIKKRTRRLEHDPPKGMKQYKWKPWTKPPESPVDLDTGTKSKSKATETESSLSTATTVVADMDKRQLVRALCWEHPTVTLDIGTLSANVNEVLKDEPALQQEVLDCIRKAVRLAAEIKRSCQRLIGLYLERLTVPGVLQPSDTDVLDHICPRIAPKTTDPAADRTDNDEEDKDASDLGGNGDKQEQFLAALLRYLYSGNYPKRQGVGNVVNTFIIRLEDLMLLNKGDRSAIRTTMAYKPSDLVRSVASQLSVELKRIYRKGSYELHEKV